MPPTEAWRELRRTLQPAERVLVPDLRRKRILRAFFNTLTPSTHSRELTLGTWLLQPPTHRDHGSAEHGRDASALLLHLKDPESSLS